MNWIIFDDLDKGLSHSLAFFDLHIFTHNHEMISIVNRNSIQIIETAMIKPTYL